MRLLIAHHATWNDDPAGRLARRVHDELRLLGHEVRALPIERLGIALPVFPAAVADSSQRSFEQLDDTELVEYREALRQTLDVEIAAFDPQIVHVQHAWLLAHLVLEAGVPYVASVWPDELDSLAGDRRFRRSAVEAVENAGRLLTIDEPVRRRLQTTFPDVESERLMLLDTSADAPLVEQLEAIYRAVLDERFGNPTSLH